MSDKKKRDKLVHLSAAVDLLTAIKLSEEHGYHFVVTEHKTLTDVGEKCESCYLTTNGNNLFSRGGLVRGPSFLADESVGFFIHCFVFVSLLYAIFIALNPFL